MSITKKWIIAALILIVSGIILGVIAFVAIGFNPEKMNSYKTVTQTFDIDKEFNNISVEADIEDIEIVWSDSEYRVVCEDLENVKHEVVVKDDTLYYKNKTDSNWWDNIGFSYNSDSPKITFYIPKKDYKNVSLITDTGDIIVSELNADSLTLDTDTGKTVLKSAKIVGDISLNTHTGRTTLEDVTCDGFISKGDTGDLKLKNVVATGDMNIERDTGDVEFDSCDAKNININTDTGDVTGSLKSGKSFETKTDTGDTDVPKSSEGGSCEVETDTGDIIITVE